MFADNPAFLIKIVENPADDTPRLVYCDWLEERGDEFSLARATFIRNQIACFQMEQNPNKYNKETEYCGVAYPICDNLRSAVQITLKDILEDQTGEILRLAREAGSKTNLKYTAKGKIKEATFTKPKEICNYHKMLKEFCDLQNKYWKYWIGSALTKTLDPTTLEPEDIYDFGFQRGFVHDLSCPPVFWFEHHKELSAEQPITDVIFYGVPSITVERPLLPTEHISYWNVDLIRSGGGITFDYDILLRPQERDLITSEQVREYLLKTAPQGIEITDEIYLQTALEIRFPGKKFRLELDIQQPEPDYDDEYDTDLEDAYDEEFQGPIDSEDM